MQYLSTFSQDCQLQTADEKHQKSELTDLVRNLKMTLMAETVVFISLMLCIENERRDKELS